MRKTRCGQMRRRRLLPGCTQGCYRDQSQKPLTGKEPSRAYARPGALRPSLTAAAGARQSSCRSSRQKELFSMSSRRELAARTVFCFFFGGDKLATPSLAADRATAFSGAAAAASLPAGTASAACRDRGGCAGGGETAAGASLRPNGSLAINGLSTAFRIRTTRALGVITGATAGADASPDLWAGTSADA